MSRHDPRPLSPHLQIYRLPLTAKLSIAHRITGLINSLALFLLVLLLASAAAGPDSYDTMAGIVGSWFGKLVMMVFTATLYYHLCNGIRHLFWDVGMGFDVPQAMQSGKAVLAATAVLTALTWLLAGIA